MNSIIGFARRRLLVKSRVVVALKVICAGVLLVPFEPFETLRAQSNALDHFSWGAIPSAVAVGQDFVVTLTARDLSNSIASTYSGPALLSGREVAPTPKLLITEVQTFPGHRVELSNVTTNALDVSGWRVVFYDSQSWPLPKQSFTIPPGSVCSNLGVFSISDHGNAPGVFPSFFTGFGLSWNGFPSANPLALLLLDPDGRSADFFCAADAYPALIRVPQQISAKEWLGVATSVNLNPSYTYQRVGQADHNDTGDWTVTGQNIGFFNPGLRLPFVGGPIVSALQPSTVVLTNGIWSGKVAVGSPGTNLMLHADDGLGHGGDAGPLTVIALPAVSLVIPTQAYKASPGLAGTGTITLPEPLTTNLLVSLSTSSTGLVWVPPAVTIPAGATNQDFAVSNFDDGLVEGPMVATVAASAPGFSSTIRSITNFDAVPVTLSLKLPPYALFGSAWITGGQVTSSVPVAADVAVTLTSSEPNQVLLPDFVVIPAGQNSATFGFTVAASAFIDADQHLSVTASVPGWASATSQTLLYGNPGPLLLVTLPYNLDEGSGTATNAGEVQIAGLLSTNLVVLLTNDVPDRIEVPARVVIPAGQISAWFSITVVDDNLTNGNQLVSISANATGLQGSVRGLTVVDDDVAAFAFDPLPPSQLGGEPFPITVTAINSSGTACPGYAGTVDLSAQTQTGAVPVSPSLIGPFTNGVWSGLVTINGENRQTVLMASDSTGHRAASAPFDVASGTSVVLPISDVAFDPTRNRLWAGVQSGGGSNAQSVVSIDPATGLQDVSIPVAGEPGKISISADGQFLYVGLTSSNGLVRVNLTSKAVDLRFPLPPGGTTTVTDLGVPPGDSHSVLVQMAGYSAATALYKNGVLLPNMIPTAANVTDYRFAFYDSPNNLYCLYPGGVRLLYLNDNGVQVVREPQDPQYGGPCVYAGGLLFNSSGAVYEPRYFERVATYPTNGWVAVAPSSDEVLFLSGTRLNAYDLATREAMGYLDLPIHGETVTRMLYCGSNILAIASSSTNLLLIQTALLRQLPSADFKIAQTTSGPAATVGSNFVYSISVSNTGPNSMSNVWLLDELPTDTTLVGASASSGSWQATNRIVSFHPGVLGPGAAATLQLSILPSAPGELINSAWVVGQGLSSSTNLSVISTPAIFGPVLPALTRLRASSDALAYDSVRGLLWRTTERSEAALENNLRSLSLSNGLAGPTIPLYHPSSKLAMSADQNFLYALYVNNLDGLNYTPDQFIKRANLAAEAIDEDFPVLDRVGQQSEALDFIGIAGYPSGLLVSKGDVQYEVSVYQNGAIVLSSANGLGGGVVEINPSIPSRVYRLTGGNIEGNLARLEVEPSGITIIDSSDLFSVAPFGPIPIVNRIKFASGYLFGDNGIVVNAEAMQRIGVLPASGLVETDPTSGLVYYLVNNPPEWSLVAFNAQTLAPLWAYTVPGVSGYPTDLVRCGSGRLAFRTPDDQIFVLNTEQMPHSPYADLALSQDPPPAALLTNQQAILTSRLVNLGPGPATAVFITNRVPADTIITSLASSQGWCTNLSGTVVCSLGDLPPGASAWMQMAVTLARAGTLTNVATVSASTPDPIATNNVAVTTVDYSVVPVSDLVLTHLPPVLETNLTYTLMVSNAGPDNAFDVMLYDNLGLGGALISATASQGTVAISDNSFSASLGVLSNGTTATLTLVIGPCCGGMVLNQASVGSSSFDPVPNNNLSSGVLSLAGGQFADEVPVPAIDITYDPARALILAALSQPLGATTQSVMGVQVQTRAVEPFVNVGNDLRRIALSDDSQFLYVGLADTGGVARIDMAARAVDLRFALNTPDAPFGPYMAEDLAVVPGNPTSLAAARGGYAGYYSGVAIFDSGVQRPDTIELGSGAAGYTIAFLDPTNLCAMSPWDVQASSLTLTGLTNLVPAMSGYGGGVFAAGGGLTFTSFGDELDPKAGTVVATYPATGLAAPDLANRRVYYLGYNSLLQAFDSATQSLLWSVDLSGLSGAPQHLISLGTNGLAFTTDANRLFIVRPSQLEMPMADVGLAQSLSAAPVTAGVPFTCTLTAANHGPWTATGVLITNPLPSNMSFVSASSSQGSCGLTNGAVICALGALANGDSATVSISLIALSPGNLTNTAILARNELDPNPANDVTTSEAGVVPQPAVTVQDAIVVQGASTTAIAFPISLSAPCSAPVSIAYSTADGTAVASQNYNSATGVFSIPAGTTTASLRLSIILNTPGLEPEETFYLNLSSVTNASLTRTQAIATILLKSFRTVSISGVSVAASTSDVTNALFQLSLNQAGSSPVSVQYQTIDGSALGGLDFESKAGTMVFAPGVTNMTLAVPIFNNPAWQQSKTFSVVLFAPQNAVLGAGEALGTISSSAPVPALVILTPPVSQVLSPGETAAFSIDATGNPLPLSYQWSFNGTNLAGATSSSLSLPDIGPLDGGIYAVRLVNNSGATTNATANLIVLQGLDYDLLGDTLILRWSGPYVLQSASNAAGPYLDIPNAISPATNSVARNSALFFRLRSQLAP